MARMNSLVAALNTTVTEKGALTNRSSGSAMLDFYGQMGAMRGQSDSNVNSTFSAAFAAERALALRSLFYLRDVRGGKGERKTFRTILDWLVKNDPQVVINNLDNISFYGRYDDLARLINCGNTKVKNAVVAKVKAQLAADKNDEHPSLLAKWMPSINASSTESKSLAKKWIRALGMSEAEYRKTLSALRAQIKVVERYMCARDWDSINFEHVPSNAAKLYRKAFKTRAPERYSEYLGAVEKGEKTIKASTLYPYDLVRPYLKAGGYYGGRVSVDRTIEAQWKALPNYLADDDTDFLVIADTSGSMFDHSLDFLPICVSVSLALYSAERNRGAFKGFWMNFSTSPTFQQVRGETLADKISNMDYSNWCGSTNVDKAFELILSRARAANVPADEMPKMLMVISDMQFDGHCTVTNLETWKKKFATYGYEAPTIVFWNVNARPGQSPITVNDKGVMLVSGASAETFRAVLSGKNLSAYDAMVNTLSNERYDRVVVD